MPLKHTFKHDLMPAFGQMHSMLSFIQGDLQESEITAEKQKRVLQFLKALVVSTKDFEKALASVVSVSLSEAEKNGVIDSKADMPSTGLKDDVEYLQNFVRTRGH